MEHQAQESEFLSEEGSLGTECCSQEKKTHGCFSSVKPGSCVRWVKLFGLGEVFLLPGEPLQLLPGSIRDDKAVPEVWSEPLQRIKTSSAHPPAAPCLSGFVLAVESDPAGHEWSPGNPREQQRDYFEAEVKLSEAGSAFVHVIRVTAELHLELGEDKTPEETDCTSFVFNELYRGGLSRDSETWGRLKFGQFPSSL